MKEIVHNKLIGPIKNMVEIEFELFESKTTKNVWKNAQKEDRLHGKPELI